MRGSIGNNTASVEDEEPVGVASGKSYGNALNWSYTLALPIGGRTWHVAFDDWMLLQPDGVLINRADMSKFGIRLGEIVLFFSKEAAMEAETAHRAAAE